MKKFFLAAAVSGAVSLSFAAYEAQAACKCKRKTQETVDGSGGGSMTETPGQHVCLYHSPSSERDKGGYHLVPEKAAQTHIGVHPGDFIADLEECKKRGVTKEENANAYEDANAGRTPDEAEEVLGDFSDGDYVRDNQKVGRDGDGNNTDDPSIGQSEVTPFFAAGDGADE